MKSKLVWYFRQLFPLTYRSHYHDSKKLRHFAVWKMWFGRVFEYEDHIVLGD